MISGEICWQEREGVLESRKTSVGAFAAFVEIKNPRCIVKCIWDEFYNPRYHPSWLKTLFIIYQHICRQITVAVSVGPYCKFQGRPQKSIRLSTPYRASTMTRLSVISSDNLLLFLNGFYFDLILILLFGFVNTIFREKFNLVKRCFVLV